MANQHPPGSVEEIWRTYDAMEQRLTGPLSDRMLDLAQLGPGFRVLDLATGRGEPAVRAAHRIAPAGVVVGVDHHAAMLEMARHRADLEGVTNLELYTSDVHSLKEIGESKFDVVLARWALMYFQDPVLVLQEARRRMKPNGRLVAALWAEPQRVSYFMLPRQLLSRYAALPQADSGQPDFDQPGPCRYSRMEFIERDFTQAGFRIDTCEEINVDVMEVSTGAEAVEWARCFGMTRLLQNQPRSVQEAWEADMIRTAESMRKDGWIRLGGITRIVVAI